VVCRHEWLIFRRDRLLMSALVLLIVSAAYGVHTGWHWTSERGLAIDTVLKTRTEKRARQREQLQTHDPGGAVPSQRSPVLAYFIEEEATLPQQSLAAISTGTADGFPYVARVTIYSDRSSLFDDASGTENPAALAFGRFDLAFVVTWLLPLVVIACTYNLISGERESGTLALTLAHPVSLRTVAVAKALVRGGVLAAAVVIAAIAGLAATAGRFGGREAALTGVFAAVAIVYVAFWISAACAVNAQGWSSAANALALGTLWLLLVIVLPSLLSLGLSVAAPPPSRPDLVNDMRLAYVRAKDKAPEVLADYYRDHPEYAPDSGTDVDNAFREYWAIQQRADGDMAGAVRRFDAALAAQRRLAGRLQFVSPAILLQRVLDGLSGNNHERFQSFSDQVQHYFDQVQASLTPSMFRSAPLTLAQYDGLPQFRFEEEPLARQIASVGAPALGLAAFALFAVGAGWLALSGTRGRR
jgi:ABC-2 type transport system permease protein